MPPKPVAQKAHFIAQPTCVLMHMLQWPLSSRSSTHSICKGPLGGAATALVAAAPSAAGCCIVGRFAAVGQGEKQFLRAIVVLAVDGDFRRPDIELRRQLLPQLAGQIGHLLPGTGPFFKEPLADLRGPIGPLAVLEHPGLKLFGRTGRGYGAYSYCTLSAGMSGQKPLGKEKCKVRGLVHFSARTDEIHQKSLPENMDLTPSRWTE